MFPNDCKDGNRSINQCIALGTRRPCRCVYLLMLLAGRTRTAHRGHRRQRNSAWQVSREVDEQDTSHLESTGPSGLAGKEAERISLPLSNNNRNGFCFKNEERVFFCLFF